MNLPIFAVAMTDQSAQKIVKHVFFSSGVWWLSAGFSLDREMACDDAVLAQSPSPGDTRNAWHT